MPSAVRDSESEVFLAHLAADEKLRSEKIKDVKNVLVLFSSRAIAYDRSALQQKIHLTYPNSKVFFMTSLGISVGLPCPTSIDLMIDFTGPGQKRKFLLARKLRAITRVAVGRNAGFFRPYIYDRVFDESIENVPADILERERFVQRNVLRLAGIPLSQKGELLPDLGKEINAGVAVPKRTSMN